MKEINYAGSICGGVISKSYWIKQMNLYGVWAYAMSWVMPDKWFAEYRRALTKSENPKYGRDRRRAEKEYAEKIFKKHAYSTI